MIAAAPAHVRHDQRRPAAPGRAPQVYRCRCAASAACRASLRLCPGGGDDTPTAALQRRRRWSSRWARPFLASAFSRGFRRCPGVARGFHCCVFPLLWVFSWVLRPLLRTLRRFFGFFFLCGAVTRRFHLLLLLPPFRESSSESAVRRFLRFFNYFLCTTNNMSDLHHRRHREPAPPV